MLAEGGVGEIGGVEKGAGDFWGGGGYIVMEGGSGWKGKGVAGVGGVVRCG